MRGGGIEFLIKISCYLRIRFGEVGGGGDPSLKSSLFRRVYSYQVVRSDVKYKTCWILS